MSRSLVTRRLIHASVVVLVLAALTLTPAAPAHAGSFWYVSDLIGSDANACNAPNVPCKTINAAIAKAQSGDVIQVTAGIYTGSGAGAIVHVDKDLIINGGFDFTFSAHLNYTILNGQHLRRGLRVTQGAKVQMSDVAILWGHAPDGGGALVEGGLVGIRMYFARNRALNGGGIYFNGRIGDYVQLIQSVLYANEYFHQGGGLFIDGFRFVDPVGQPHVASGGSFSNVTVSNNLNIASQDEEHGPPPPATGGGVYVSGGYLSTQHATFAENTIFDGRIFTQNGAGITVAPINGTGFAGLQNTLIADGCLAPPGHVQSAGANVERTNTCNLTHPQDRKNVDPLIYPATVNPGPFTTITHALSPFSPAIDWANPQWCTISHDQRGVPRPQGAACDVGAFERTDADPAMGFMTHPGKGFEHPDRCPTISWHANGRPRHNQCSVDAADLIEAILGVVDDARRGGQGRSDPPELSHPGGRPPLPDRR